MRRFAGMALMVVAVTPAAIVSAFALPDELPVREDVVSVWDGQQAVVGEVVPLPPPPAPPPTHVVEDGESLWSIGDRAGVSACELANANGISSELVLAGITLVLPAAGTVPATCELEALPQPAPVFVAEELIDVWVAPVVHDASGAAAAICQAPWPSCQAALAVAQCESTDYYDDDWTGYVGAFQIDMSIHEWRFYALGFDPAQATDPYVNSVVAHDIWQDGGWSPWPSCGRRAY